MLTRQRRLKKSLFPYYTQKVGEVIFFKCPFGFDDGWLRVAEKGYNFALGEAHRYAIRDVEKKTGAKFHVFYGDGFVRVTRIR